MREQEHNYELYREYRAIKIVPIDETRPILKLQLDSDGFWYFIKGLSADKNSIEIEDGSIENEHHKIPMFCIYRVLRDAVEYLYESWSPPEEHDLSDIREEMREAPWRLHADKWKKIIKQDNIIYWAKTVTEKTISKKISEMWHEIMDEDFDELLVELHRKFFSVSAGSGNWNNLRIILNNRNKFYYLIKDLLKYPAARISILHGINLPRDSEKINSGNINWMDAYLPRNVDPYTSLNRTLMNLPGGVTYHLYFHLRNFTLNEPVKTRLKMYAYLTLNDPAYPHNNKEEKNNVILRSDEETIEEALRFMFHYFPSGNKFDLRRTNKIISLFHTIYDYPGEVGEWDMLGLAKRSEQYHHETRIQREERLRKQRELSKKIAFSKTALPPISLPKNENITFLNSYSEVEREGEKMQHCIASYATGAVKGDYYLFHIDYNGEMASAQVTPAGYVTQIYGPRDRKNTACDYGKKMLTEWGKKLIDAGSPVKRIISEEEFERLKGNEPEEESNDEQRIHYTFPELELEELEAEEIPF